MEYADYEIDEEPTVEDVDVKIRPDFYIHKALLKSQDCLVKENSKEGFLQFIMVVMHIKSLCAASKKIPITYDQLLFDELKKKEISSDNDLVTQTKKAQIELELMMKYMFESTLKSDPLIDKKRKSKEDLPDNATNGKVFIKEN